MLSFLFHKKRDEVRKILHGRMNRSYVKNVSGTKRSASRGPLSEVAWLVDCDPKTRLPLTTQVRAVLTKDICATGLSVLHPQPTADKFVVVGLLDEQGPRFIRCEVVHTTPLGYGYYQTGLRPIDLVFIDPEEVDSMQQRVESVLEPQPV